MCLFDVMQRCLWVFEEMHVEVNVCLRLVVLRQTLLVVVMSMDILGFCLMP